MGDDRPPPFPRRRATGWLLVVVGVALGLCALLGAPVDARWARLAAGAVAVVLLVVGAVASRATMPGLDTIVADASGLAMTLPDGTRVTVPWADVDRIWLRRVKPLVGEEGWLLRVHYRGAARRPEALRVFEGQEETGLGQLLIGLTADQESVLRRRLPDTAGDRFGIRE